MSFYVRFQNWLLLERSQQTKKNSSSSLLTEMENKIKKKHENVIDFFFQLILLFKLKH